MNDARGLVPRSGFAMITVLWTMTVASVIALAAAMSGRNTVNAARNRIQAERAFWTATGCARRTQAAADGLLQAAQSPDQAAQLWRVIDRAIATLQPPVDSTCDVRMEAAGTKLDMNAASDEMLRALLDALGAGDAAAASMIDALDDWRDSDDVVRPAGAERDWYVTAERPLPRNAPIGDIRELAYVRGFDNIERYDSVLTTEPGRVSLASAPAVVLLAVPGFTSESAELVASLHDAGTPVRDLAEIVERLSPSARAAMLSRYSEIARLTTADPDAWLLTTRAWSGSPRSIVTLQWRIGRSGSRVVVLRTSTSQ